MKHAQRPVDGWRRPAQQSGCRQTVYACDPLNHLQSATDPLNRTTGSVYDAVGNLTSLTDATQPVGCTTSYSYDATPGAPRA